MIVHSEPGYAIDWDWSSGLTVWSHDADRLEQILGTHRLDHVPKGETQAAHAAERWWHREGRAELSDRSGRAQQATAGTR